MDELPEQALAYLRRLDGDDPADVSHIFALLDHRAKMLTLGDDEPIPEPPTDPYPDDGNWRAYCEYRKWVDLDPWVGGILVSVSELGRAVLAIADSRTCSTPAPVPNSAPDPADPTVAIVAEAVVPSKPKVVTKEVGKTLNELRDLGRPWSSMKDMAVQVSKILGYKVSTHPVSNAIQGDEKLKSWMRGEPARPRATSLDERVTDNTAQSRELSPEDDAAIRGYIETASPEEKAEFLTMPASKQLEFLELMANDPDKYPTIFGRRG